jgi:DeoR family suf operon transcriptional repressor
MKSTRERVLQTLSTHPRSTIIEIAAEVGINAISVRHHLTHLQAGGLVAAEEERHGVGRPRMVYLLTENGMEHFPTGYLRLTNNLLDHLKLSVSPGELDGIFKSIADKLTSEYQPSLSHLNLEQKLELLTRVMAKEGFNIEWKHSGNQYEIREISCPFYRIGKNHPEVCLFDRTLISNILSISPEKIQIQHLDDSLCAFIVLD